MVCIYEKIKITLLLVLPLLMYCNDAPEIVFPVPDNIATVSGRVFPANEDVTVYLLGPKGVDSISCNPHTEMYQFDRVAYGTYYLQVKATGYGTYEQSITVNKPVVGVFDIKLSQQPKLIGFVKPYDGTVIDEEFFSNQNSLVTDSTIRIRIDFTERMDTVSVIEALSVQPELPKTEYQWVSLNSLLIDFPRERLTEFTELTVLIDNGAMDVYDHHLEMDFTLFYPIDTLFTQEPTRPKLIYAQSPNDGDRNISVAAPIIIRFDTLMNQVTVEKAFSIEPAVDVVFEWEEMPTYSIVSVKATNGLSFDIDYLVSLEKGWMAIDSSLQGEDYSFTFKTVRALIEESTPKNGKTGVSITEPILVKLNFKPDYENFSKAFTIEPAVDSMEFSYSAITGQVRIDHAPFDTATVYTVTIDSTLQSKDGSHIERTVVFSFVTITETDRWGMGDTIAWTSNPLDKSMEWPINKGLVFTFYEQMDVAKVESSLVVSPEFSYYPVWTINGDVSYRLEIRPLHYLRSGTTYTIRLDANDLSQSGIKNDPIAISFTTQPFRCVGHSPAAGQHNVGVTVPVSLSFNTPVDTSTLATAVQSTPTLVNVRVDTVVANGEMGVWNYLLEHNSYIADTAYMIAVDTSVTDLFGTPLKRGVSFEFLTGK